MASKMVDLATVKYLSLRKGKLRDIKETCLYIEDGKFYCAVYYGTSASKMKLGHAKDMTVTAARTLAKSWLELHLQLKAVKEMGKNKKQSVLPSAKSKSIKIIPSKDKITVGDIIQIYAERYGSKNIKNWGWVEKLLRTVCSDIIEKPVNSIKSFYIEHLYISIGKHTPGKAYNFLKNLKKIFSAALEWGLTEINPAEKLRVKKTQSRDRVLTKDELKIFVSKLNEHKNKDLKDFTTILMLTGARQSDLLNINSEQIDLIRNIWIFKSVKTGIKTEIPLSEAVWRIISERMAVTERGKPLFNFTEGSRPGHKIKKLMLSCGIKDAVPHDLRRTFCTALADKGSNLPTLKRIMGITSGEALDVYMRSSGVNNSRPMIDAMSNEINIY